MTKQEKQEIIRELAILENSYPADDLILTYSDFLRFGQNLRHSKFNHLVLENLSELTVQLWTTTNKISRINLLTCLKQCVITAHNEMESEKNIFGTNKEIKNIFTEKTNTNLFNIFRQVHTGQQYLTDKQNEEGKQISNYILKYCYLNPDKIQWLCENALSDTNILNRVLRYPESSPIISLWARDNRSSGYVRSRRAEVTSWIIDEDIHYQISIETIVEDFEYQNEYDKKTFLNYVKEMEFNQHLADELGDILPVKSLPYALVNEHQKNPEIIEGFTEPTYTASKRFYRIPLVMDAEYNVEIPDFDKFSCLFYNNTITTMEITMIWSIGYSRLSVETKCELLKKYYNQKTLKSLVKVAKKYKIIPLLKWMLNQK